MISALAGCHESFPADLWDELLPQVELTLNMLRPFGPNPKISAYEGIHGRQCEIHYAFRHCESCRLQSWCEPVCGVQILHFSDG
jgi:hypothetical protein